MNQASATYPAAVVLLFLAIVLLPTAAADPLGFSEGGGLQAAKWDFSTLAERRERPECEHPRPVDSNPRGRDWVASGLRDDQLPGVRKLRRCLPQRLGNLELECV